MKLFGKLNKILNSLILAKCQTHFLQVFFINLFFLFTHNEPRHIESNAMPIYAIIKCSITINRAPTNHLNKLITSTVKKISTTDKAFSQNWFPKFLISKVKTCHCWLTLNVILSIKKKKKEKKKWML